MFTGCLKKYTPRDNLYKYQHPDNLNKGETEMKLRGIEFGNVLGASGAQGFFGEGYWFHRFWKPFGLDFTGMTFVAKTTTLNGREGNMPMQEDGITPREFMPRCIFPNFSRVKNIPISIRMFLNGLMLNAVSLSGPGAEPLLETGRWQDLTERFFISVMSVARTAEERILEIRSFVKKLAQYMPDFKSKFGLQINISCPNVGLNIDELVYEAETHLDIASELEVALMPKFNVLTPVTVAKQIAEHPSCDALCISNTIPWGKLPERINWKKLFGTDVSPLAEFGGGGLSSWPLLPLVEEWVREARKIGIIMPINAGGGMLAPRDVNTLARAGASSVFLGSIASLRPWRVKATIRYANQLTNWR